FSCWRYSERRLKSADQLAGIDQTTANLPYIVRHARALLHVHATAFWILAWRISRSLQIEQDHLCSGKFADKPTHSVRIRGDPRSPLYFPSDRRWCTRTYAPQTRARQPKRAPAPSYACSQDTSDDRSASPYALPPRVMSPVHTGLTGSFHLLGTSLFGRIA